MVAVDSWCSLDGCCYFLVVKGCTVHSQLKAINPYWAVVLSLNPEEEDPDEADPGPQLRLPPALEEGEGGGGGLRGAGEALLPALLLTSL